MEIQVVKYLKRNEKWRNENHEKYMREKNWENCYNYNKNTESIDKVYKIQSI